MGSTELCSPSKTAQELLLEFKATGRQEPFEEIVRRYAGMVYHVCLRITKNNHDAEDAVQAVFLTLAVQARQNKEIRYIGPWLQQVAHRLSLDLRKSRKRREKREERYSRASGCERQECQCASQVHYEELKGIINQEINKLPPKYRVPLLMHYFGGLSREEMASELKCKPGTLGVRLHRAREMLGQRLARRGVAMTEGMMGLAVAYAVQSAVAEQIISSTCQAASQIVTTDTAATHLVPAQLVALARGAVRSVLLAKVKTVAALLVAMGCAMAAGAEVVAKVTPLDLGLDLQMRIGDWVKEYLTPLSTPLQVNATQPSKVLDAATASPPSSPAQHAPLALGEPPQFELPPSIQLPPMSLSLGGGARSDAVGQMFETMPSAPLTGDAFDVTPRATKRASLPANRAFTSLPDVARPYQAGSLHLNTVAQAPAILPVQRRPDRHRSPRIDGPAPAWRGESSPPDRGGKSPRDDRGERPPVRPERPRRPGQSGGNGGGTDNGGTGGGPAPGGNGGGNPVQVVTLDGSSDIRLFVPPRSAAPAGFPRSPAAVGLYGTGSPPAPARLTAVNFDSIGGASFSISGYSAAAYNSVLHSDSDFSAPLTGTAQVDVLDAADLQGSQYVDRTYFKFDAQGEQLVVIGRQSRAKLTGMTVDAGAGVLSGWGVVGPAATLDQSGQVIADGLGQPRVLDISSVGAIQNITENTGANGWYARNGGKIVLRELRILPGTRSYTWGEDPSDPQIDLVNSVRVRIREALTPGTLQIALTAVDRGEVPPIPTGEQFIGLWQMQTTGIILGGLDLTVRYDDGLIADLGMDENSVRLWGYRDGAWQLFDDGFALDSTHKLVSGGLGSAGGGGGVSFFAVAATPEPAAAGIMIGAALLLLRRRR